MKRPEIDNIEGYRELAEKGPNQAFITAFHGLSQVLIHPHVLYQENTREVVNRGHNKEIATGLSLVHSDFFDPFGYASAISGEDHLSWIEGKTAVLAKSGWFTTPVIGQAIRIGGALPMLREQDVVPTGDPAIDELAEIERLARNKLGQEIITLGIQNDLVPVSFPETTRNRGDRRFILDDIYKYGLVRAMMSADTPKDKYLIFMGIYYNNRRVKNIWRPSIAVGHMALCDDFELNEDTKNQIKDKQQSVLNDAVEHYETRNRIRKLGSKLIVPKHSRD